MGSLPLANCADIADDIRRTISLSAIQRTQEENFSEYFGRSWLFQPPGNRLMFANDLQSIELIQRSSSCAVGRQVQ